MLAKALIGIGPANREIGFQISELEPGILETADRRSKGVALLNLVLRKVEGLLRRGDRMKRDGQAFLRQFAHQRAHRTAFRSQQIVDGYAYLVEEQFGRIGGEMPKFFKVSAVAETGPVGLDENETHSPRAAFRRGPGHDDDEIAHLPVRDEGFLARDHKFIALAHCAGANALQVASGAGFGHGDGAYGLARYHSRQPFSLLLGGSVAEQVSAAHVIVHGEVGSGACEAGVAEFLYDDRIVPKISAGAAELFGNLRAEQAGCATGAP